MGYNTASMYELQQKLSPQDIPVLLGFLRQIPESVGGEFGLASLCEPAIGPVRKGFDAKQIPFTDADDILNLMANFEGCPAGARQHARDVRSEISEVFHSSSPRPDHP